LIAPKGYYYYGISTDNNLFLYEGKEQGGGSVTVTCKCTDGNANNCSPVGNGGKIACVIEDGCNSCSRSQSVKSSKGEEFILNGGFVMPELGINFAKEGEDLPYVFESLFLYPDVVEQYTEFLLMYYNSLDEIPDVVIDDNSAIAPEGFRFVVLNIYGRTSISLLPDNEITKTAPGGGTYSCPCTGQGKCKVKSTFGYYTCEKDGCDVCNGASKSLAFD